jgi:Na+/H+ antiporter NhaD/arsenite permease-like protein
MTVTWDFTTTATLVIFILTYIGIAAGGFWGIRLDRAGITLLGGIAMLAFGCTTLQRAVKDVNFESILLLFGLMVISSQLQRAGFYHKVAQIISKFMSKPALFLLILMVSSGILSAFLNNDVVCLAFTPIVTISLMRKKLNPIPFLIALPIASCIGCSITIIGNAQNVLIGEIAHLSFGKYMLFAIVPASISMITAYFIILLIGRKHFALKLDENFVPPEEDSTPMHTWRTIKGVTAIVVIIILFFTPLPRYLVALVVAALLLCSHKLESKDVLKLVDWQLLILFIGLFVVVGTFHDIGLGKAALQWFSSHGLDLNNPYVLTLSTGVLSNLINNSAAVMLLVHLVDLSNPVNGYILALANTLGGTMLLVGSVATIIVVKGAKEFGVNISFWKFASYGIPVTAASYIVFLSWLYFML